MDINQEMERKSQRLAWFCDAKFGMFIHWGLYSHLAGEWKGTLIERIGEQIMRFCEIPVKEYEEIAKEFNPVRFNAEEWVLLAKNAGMKYIVITAKHHDGFAMYHSKCSPFNIVEDTPYGRDPMKDLAEACQKHGIKLCFYYSHYQDWHHPDGGVKPPVWEEVSKGPKNFETYMYEKALPQVKELLTQYGPVGLIWYDTPVTLSKEHAEIFANIVHELQPDCLVSPRVGHKFGDYQGFRDNQVPSCPGANVFETCATMNDTWGYRKNDHNWKSTGTLIRLLVSIVSKGGNYLLNVGPTGEGVIPQPSVDRLLEIGQWLKVNGESIYGADGRLVPYELDWGAFTAKPGKLYVHLFDWPKDGFAFSGIRNRIKRAYLLADCNQRELEFTQEYDAANDYHKVRIQLPEQAPDQNVSVIVLDIEGTADIDPTIVQKPDGTLTLNSFLAEIHNKEKDTGIRIAPTGTAENWLNKEDWLSWEFKVVKPGRFSIQMNTLTEKMEEGNPEIVWEGEHEFSISAAGQEVLFTVKNDGLIYPRDLFYWKNIVTECGQITFDQPGLYHLKLKPVAIHAALGLGPKLKSLFLKPVQ